MDAEHDEARLLRRIVGLRKILHYADDPRIAAKLKQLLAETENRLGVVRSSCRRKGTLH